MTILYIFIALLVGWVIGFLDSNLRTSKKIEAAEAKAELAISEAEKKIAEAQVKVEVPVVVDEPGLLRLKNVDGVASLEMDGAPLNVKTVSADQKRRLIELLTFIRPWVESGQPLPPVSKPPAPVSAPSRPAPAQPAVSSFKPISTQPVSPLKLAEEKNIRSLSIVAQIDAVLQSLLVDTPLAGRGIRLTESSIGGVEVYVGLQKYPSIDDVPDAEIKSSIRAAIAEWEENFTPGA